MEDPASTLVTLLESVAGSENVVYDNLKDWLNCDTNDSVFEHLIEKKSLESVKGFMKRKVKKRKMGSLRCKCESLTKRCCNTSMVCCNT